ncbi:DUF1987 domain-containing protein [Labilibacter marinus]|uniref:DUF1987 domain-containing protein n=1 Tax=Labilibacter marinus TaxID=1477105 RepID=UPI00082D5C06|nr:DUF1987 domain-containing protein [Labilibacter marinus]
MTLTDNLVLNSTETTPEVKFNCGNGELEMNGVLLPLDCDAFFNPLLKWLEAYMSKPALVTKLALKLEYMNTRASKYLFQMLKRMNEHLSKDKKLSVKWVYDKDDLDMLEAGEDFSALIDSEFVFVEA